MPGDEPLLTQHHILPVLRCKVHSSGAYTTAEAGTAFTFGEGTVVTCWHCVKRPAGPDETYGVAVRRGGITAPYEFCSIDDLGRDEMVPTWRLAGSIGDPAESHLGDRIRDVG
jgi:hypothetical protein